MKGYLSNVLIFLCADKYTLDISHLKGEINSLPALEKHGIRETQSVN